jgi:hypothetical protein
MLVFQGFREGIEEFRGYQIPRFSLSAKHGCGVEDGLDRLDVPCTAAEDTGEGIANLRFGGVRVAGEEFFGSHDHARCAVPALDGARIDEGGLEGVKPLRVFPALFGVFTDILNGLDLVPLGLGGEVYAGIYWHPIDKHTARPAFAGLAAVLNAEVTLGAQHL